MVFHCIFLGNKAVIITSKQGTRIFFLLMPPGHPIILLKSNLFNMAAVSVKRSIDYYQISLCDSNVLSIIRIKDMTTQDYFSIKIYQIILLAASIKKVGD